MKKKKNILKSCVLTLLVITMLSPNFAYATNNTSKLKFEKISNPNSGEREIDGLDPEGNRENSYSWAMTTRGNYVYVGTNKNIVGGAASSFVDSLVASGMTEDIAWEFISSATDGDIPRPTTTVGGEIYKCNITTGEIEKIYTAKKGVAFRMAMEFNGNLYFASYTADISANNYIYKIDENDKVTEIFTSTGGASMRASCIYDNSLLFGGTDSRITLDPGDENCVKLAIIKKDSNDDTKWDRIADYRDFKEYSNDDAIKNSITSPIWDICSYKGYIYATIPNSAGAVMYKGHPATENEPANEYGWYWEEVLGRNNPVEGLWFQDIYEANIKNPDNPQASLVSLCITPFVFKDKLYLMNFDNTISAAIIGLSGRLMKMSGKETDLTQYLSPLYETLKNPQKIWCYNDVTKKYTEVDGFNNLMIDTCNEYLWRTEIYNDELYITTMDSAVLYNWVAQFKGSDFTTMTEEELNNAIETIDSILKELNIDLLKQIKTMLTEYIANLDNVIEFNKFVVKYEDLIIRLEELSKINTNNNSYAMFADLINLLQKIDLDSLRMYAYIVRLLNNNTWGFDLIKTSDGINFEVVVDDGFGDKYNYGGRSLITTEAGLYLGTANPFYGAQLWRISGDKINNDEEPKGEEPSDEEPGNEDPKDEEPNDKKPVDNTIAVEPLPNTGIIKTLIALAIVALISTVITLKYIKYKKLKI